MVRVLLKFTEKVTDQPITSEVILEHGTNINILSAHIDEQGGKILADIPSDKVEKITNAFRKRGVLVEVSKLIEVDKNTCSECGACYSLCPVNAIILEDDSVIFDDEKCVGSTCGLCVDACPVRAIKLLL